MIENLFGVIFLLAHFILCLGVFLVIRKQKTMLQRYMIPMMFIIPMIGPACVYGYLKILQGDITKMEISEEEELEERKSNEEKILDDISEVSDLVSLEDALIMNDVRVRRKMILDIINDNPEEYLGLIRKASLNDDTEVVHYATTIISEISSKYDKELTILEKEYKENDNDERGLIQYCNFLYKYLNKGLVSGEMERIKRQEYSEILRKMLDSKNSLKYMSRLVDNEIKLENYKEVEKLLSEMMRNWPMEEETWFLRFKYYCKVNRMQEAMNLTKIIHERNIYISTKNKTYMSFFDQGGRLSA